MTKPERKLLQDIGLLCPTCGQPAWKVAAANLIYQAGVKAGKKSKKAKKK